MKKVGVVSRYDEQKGLTRCSTDWRIYLWDQSHHRVPMTHFARPLKSQLPIQCLKRRTVNGKFHTISRGNVRFEISAIGVFSCLFEEFNSI